MGRLLTEADDQEGAARVAVMSYRIWKEQYGSDPSVVGANYQLFIHSLSCALVAAMVPSERTVPLTSFTQ